MTPTKQPLAKVNFTERQLQELRKLFPYQVLAHDTPESRVREYFGQQSVLLAIEGRIQRDHHEH